MHPRRVRGAVRQDRVPAEVSLDYIPPREHPDEEAPKDGCECWLCVGTRFICDVEFGGP